MVTESKDTRSIYTIALFANTTYRILFFIHFIICSPALSILSPNQNEGPHGTQDLSAYSPYRASLNVGHSAHQQTQIKY